MFQWISLHRLSVDQQLSGRDIIETRYELDQGGLCRTRLTNNPRSLSRPDMQAYIRKHIFCRFLLIFKVNMPELNLALCDRDIPCLVFFDINLFIQHFNDPPAGCEGTCEHKKDIRDHHQRIQDLEYIA